MATISPLRGLRPRPELAKEVASVPYDVVDRDEARALAGTNRRSFLRVTRPEIDLAASVDPYADAVYAQGKAALDRLVADRVLVRDRAPAFYAYALTMNGHTQTGLVLGASVADYEQNIVRKHEHTRPDKEHDRVRHIEATRAQTGKVLLVHPASEVVEAELAHARAAAADTSFTADDGIQHALWVIDDPARIARLQRAFAAMGSLYIADGHHRSAAASRVARAQRQAGGPTADTEMFVAVSFPASEVRILPYHRVVHDLNGRSPAAFVAEVRARFDVRAGKPETSRPGQLGMFVAGAWYTLQVRARDLAGVDRVARLDVSVLQDRLLSPVLGIADPRRDPRIQFVGGSRGDGELVRRVEALTRGDQVAVAFSLHPTSIEDLVAIADRAQVMPPKSTWFEPKLRDGLVTHRF
ncbi:MAG TPA: DUF1015 family protein [Kofleriaceae bacterium]